jgi:hypothetical protein
MKPKWTLLRIRAEAVVHLEPLLEAGGLLIKEGTAYVSRSGGSQPLQHAGWPMRSRAIAWNGFAERLIAGSISGSAVSATLHTEG